VRVRRNITALTPAEINSLARGVAALKQRPRDWSTSWALQANLHGFLQEPVVYLGFGTCQHGNWWFLPWHRMYLYYFEQILRDASGDTNLTLPYWDWTDPDQRSLPAPFLDPNSPLYEPNRSFEANAGGALDPAAVRWTQARAEIAFSSTLPQRGFGGQAAGRPGSYQPHGRWNRWRTTWSTTRSAA